MIQHPTSNQQRVIDFVETEIASPGIIQLLDPAAANATVFGIFETRTDSEGQSASYPVTFQTFTRGNPTILPSHSIIAFLDEQDAKAMLARILDKSPHLKDNLSIYGGSTLHGMLKGLVDNSSHSGVVIDDGTSQVYLEPSRYADLAKRTTSRVAVHNDIDTSDMQLMQLEESSQLEIDLLVSQSRVISGIEFRWGIHEGKVVEFANLTLEKTLMELSREEQGEDVRVFTESVLAMVPNVQFNIVARFDRPDGVGDRGPGSARGF